MPPLATLLVRPSDSLAEVVRHYAGHGFPSQFAARAGGNVRCMACRRDHPARWVRLLAQHHLEGGPGARQEAVVVAVECPACEERGTLALSCGPAASVEDRLILALLAGHVETGRVDLRPGL